MAENKKISQFTQALVAKDTYKIPILDGFINKIVNWLVLKNDAVSEAVTEARSDIVLTHYYDTGWKLNLLNGGVSADWANVHLGDDPTDPTDYITHNLNCALDQLSIKLLISTDGTDANSFIPSEISWTSSTLNYGYQFDYVDANNIKIQTGANGIKRLVDNGASDVISNDPYYYRVIVEKTH
jgi:hypothetical protein